MSTHRHPHVDHLFPLNGLIHLPHPPHRSIKVPVGPVWKLLPWNKGRPPVCSVQLKYVDDDFRIVEDKDGELFVYSRPVFSRP